MSAAKHTPGPTFGECLALLLFKQRGANVEIHLGRDDLANVLDVAHEQGEKTHAAQALAFTYTVERFLRAGDGSDPREPPTEAEVAEAMYALRAAIAKATGSAS